MNPRLLFFVVFSIGLLGGLFFVFKPQDNPQLGGNKTSPQPSPPLSGRRAPTSASNGEGALSPTVSTDKTFTLEVKEKKLVSGPKMLSVMQGDRVTIIITSDEPEELHVHGYDASVDLEVNKPARVSFVADQAGHFVYELEIAGVEIGALEVQPK